MDRLYRIGFLLALLSIGLIWFRSGIGKIMGGKFVGALAPTLNKLTTGNPNTWYDGFVKNTVIPNSNFFGNLIMWGEFLSALSITLGSLYLLFNKKENKIVESLFFLGLIGGLLLSLNFYFAAGWTGSSTESLNLLMFAIEAIGIGVFGKIILKRGK